jgi:hypothetical protein
MTKASFDVFPSGSSPGRILVDHFLLHSSPFIHVKQTVDIVNASDGLRYSKNLPCASSPPSSLSPRPARRPTPSPTLATEKPPLFCCCCCCAILFVRPQSVTTLIFGVFQMVKSV